MTNLIVASFNQEAEATEASHKLHELESIGDITIYEMIVIKKSAKGETAVVEVDTTAGSTTLSGMAIGSLIGALAGPVGLVAGMMTGTMIRNKIEKHQKKIAELEKDLQEILEKGKEAVKEVEG